MYSWPNPTTPSIISTALLFPLSCLNQKVCVTKEQVPSAEFLHAGPFFILSLFICLLNSCFTLHFFWHILQLYSGICLIEFYPTKVSHIFSSDQL